MKNTWFCFRSRSVGRVLRAPSRIDQKSGGREMGPGIHHEEKRPRGKGRF